jgi:hypothetical protein
MSLLPLIASEPTVIPAIAEKVYDKYWISSLSVTGTPDKYKAVIRLDKYRSGEILNGETQVIVIENLFAEAESLPQAEAVFNGLIYLVKVLGQSKGIIAPDPVVEPEPTL